MKRRSVIGPATLAMTTALLFGAPTAAQEEPSPALQQLGNDLFAELLFNNQGTGFAIACSVCHAIGESVPGKPERYYADHTPTSLTANRETTERNAQTPRRRCPRRGVRLGRRLRLDGGHDPRQAGRQAVRLERRRP